MPGKQQDEQRFSITETPFSREQGVSLPAIPVQVARQYEKLLTAFLPGGTKDCRCLTITSANSGEGVTTISTQLAVTAARSRCKVLLIDANVVRPNLHTLFRINNQRGFSNFLSDGEWFTTLQGTDNRYLSVMPLGNMSFTPLQGRAFERAMAALYQEFDLLIFDLPAIFDGLSLQQWLANQLPLALVVEQQTPLATQKEALNVLSKWNIQPVGLIRNQI